MSHILEVKIDSKLGMSPSIRCTEPDTAVCRRWCEESECDGAASFRHDDHTLVVVPCGIAEWFNWDTTASIEGYTGETTDLRSGPIVVTMAGEDGFEWHYADDSKPEACPPLSEIRLVWGSPGDIELHSDGGGEFASVFRLNARGISKIEGAGDSR